MDLWPYVGTQVDEQSFASRKKKKVETCMSPLTEVVGLVIPEVKKIPNPLYVAIKMCSMS